MSMLQTISILGETWTIAEGTEKDYPGLENCDGYTDSSARRIVIDDMTKSADDAGAKTDLAAYKRQVLRHEITHAFLEESGLSSNSSYAVSWASNEEMVDWFAIQAPKIYKVFEDLRVL